MLGILPSSVELLEDRFACLLTSETPIHPLVHMPQRAGACVFLHFSPAVLNYKLLWLCPERVTNCGWELFLENGCALVLVKDLNWRPWMSHHSRECLPPAGTLTWATLKWTAVAAGAIPRILFTDIVLLNCKKPIVFIALQVQFNNCVGNCLCG